MIPMPITNGMVWPADEIVWTPRILFQWMVSSVAAMVVFATMRLNMECRLRRLRFRSSLMGVRQDRFAKAGSQRIFDMMRRT
jgi:hypothetical protein